MLPPVCHSAISDVKCHLYDFMTDYEGLAHQVNFLISTIRMSPESTVCKAALHSYICNYFYPGCNTGTEQPQGICEDNCVAMFRICGANLIAHLFTVIPPDRDCSNTLEYLYMFGLNFTTNQSDCTLLNFPSTIPTNGMSPNMLVAYDFIVPRTYIDSGIHCSGVAYELYCSWHRMVYDFIVPRTYIASGIHCSGVAYEFIVPRK